MPVTKEKIINSIYHQVGLSKGQSRRSVETLFEIMKQTLENGEDILISGFGKFCVREKNERKGRNPATGDEYVFSGFEGILHDLNKSFNDVRALLFC